MRKMSRYCRPTVHSNLTLFTVPHRIVVNGSKQTKTIMRTDGNEIKAGLAIIILLQTDTASMMILHFYPRLLHLPF